jgi:hypothetical protein
VSHEWGDRISQLLKAESPFESESILPTQFFGGRYKNEALQPIKRLMLAVLTDAVRCYQVGSDSRKIAQAAIPGGRRVVIQDEVGWALFIRECVLRS